LRADGGVMRCNKVQKLISARSDGELDESGGCAVEAHLAQCAACRSFAVDLAAVAGGLEALTAPEPRYGFSDRTLARIARGEPVSASAGGWFSLLRPLPLGLAAASFLFGIFLTLLAEGPVESGASAGGEATVELFNGEYDDLLAEASLDEELLALLPGTED